MREPLGTAEMDDDFVLVFFSSTSCFGSVGLAPNERSSRWRGGGGGGGRPEDTQLNQSRPNRNRWRQLTGGADHDRWRTAAVAECRSGCLSTTLKWWTHLVLSSALSASLFLFLFFFIILLLRRRRRRLFFLLITRSDTIRQQIALRAISWSWRFSFVFCWFLSVRRRFSLFRWFGWDSQSLESRPSLTPSVVNDR